MLEVKTGEFVKPSDEDFDEESLDCWIDGLKPLEYWKQVATEKKVHPFQIANLPFDLKVLDFGVDMELRIYGENKSEKIKNKIANTIEKYNVDSEANKRKDGLVHNYKFIEEEDHISLQIDTGSAGVEIIKKLLKELAKTTEIKKIEVDI